MTVLPRSLNRQIHEAPQWEGAMLSSRRLRCHTYEDWGFGSSFNRQALIVVPLFDGVKGALFRIRRGCVVTTETKTELTIVPPESRSLPCSSKHRFDL